MSLCLCEDIVIKILRLLTVKSLLQLRCVSKWIKEIIESQSFVVEHLSLQQYRIIAQAGLGLTYDDSKFLVISPSFEESMKEEPGETQQRLFLGGTLHGVVCLYGTWESIYGVWESGFRLWNPSTRQLSSHHLIYYRSYTKYSGFWIDPVNKDFKVILFGFLRSNVNEEAILYKSAGKSQVKIPLGEHTQKRWCRLRALKMSSCPALIIGRMAYWICYKVDLDGEDLRLPKNAVILSFDFGQETFDQVETPVPDKLELVLCKLQGNLSLMYWGKESVIKYKCDIYSRQDGSWVNIFSFNLEHGISIDWVTWALVVGEMERVVFWFWSSSYTAMLLYDTSRRGLLSSKRVDYYIVAQDFVESLLFPVDYSPAVAGRLARRAGWRRGAPLRRGDIEELNVVKRGRFG